MISLRDILNVSRVECINRRKCAHYYYIQTKIVSFIWLNLKFVNVCLFVCLFQGLEFDLSPVAIY